MIIDFSNWYIYYVYVPIIFLNCLSWCICIITFAYSLKPTLKKIITAMWEIGKAKWCIHLCHQAYFSMRGNFLENDAVYHNDAALRFRFDMICRRCLFVCDMRNTAQVKWIRCSPSLFIRHVLYFPISYEKWTTFVFSHKINTSHTWHNHTWHHIISSNYSESAILTDTDIRLTKQNVRIHSYIL